VKYPSRESARRVD
jgi:hypothetical protein